MLKKPEFGRVRDGMLPVVLAFLLAVAVSILTVELLTGIAREKLQEQADTEAKLNANYLNAIITVNYRVSDWLINSYLSGLITVVHDSTDEDGTYVCTYKMKEEVRCKLTTDRLYEILTSFINYNDEFHSAIFIFEPGVIGDAPSRGIAAKMLPNDSVRHELLSDGYDVFNSDFYQQIAKSHGVSISVGQVAEDKHWVSLLGVPIVGEDGRLLGEFWVDAESEYTSNILSRYASEAIAVAMVLDDSLHIVSSNRTEMNGQVLGNVLSSIKELRAADEWYGQVKDCLVKDEKWIFRSGGQESSVCTYIYPVNSSYTLLILQSEDKIYQSVNHFRKLLFTLSAFGLLATLICISFILYSFQRKNASNLHMRSELRMASEIQQGMLPENPLRGQLPSSIELFGLQHPAKQVGGDFYDYKIVGNRLCFCIGDVSGKGVPAALVMSQLCSLFRYVSRIEAEPQAIVTSINKAVMDHSDDSMMCTFFVGTLDLTTGRLDYCNAGHTQPIIISNGNVDFMKIKPNMPLYGFENWKYVQESITLQRGDRLFFYTDGLTEAKNPKNVFFGSEATLQTVAENRDKPFEEMVDALRVRIGQFVEKAPQYDDITMLCIGYLGSKAINLHCDNLSKDVTGMVDKVLSVCGRESDMRLRLALEEPLQNIADYAYDGQQEALVDIVIDPLNEDGELNITLIDKGVPFNPLEGAVPDLSVPLEQRQIGGLGIHFTRQIMKRMSYTREQNMNHLKLTYQT